MFQSFKNPRDIWASYHHDGAGGAFIIGVPEAQEDGILQR